MSVKLKWRTFIRKGVKLYKELKDLVETTIKLLLVVAPLSAAYRIGVPTLTFEEYTALFLIVVSVIAGYLVVRK